VKIRPWFFVLAIVSSQGHAADLRALPAGRQARILALADDSRLTLPIGQWNPEKKWIQGTDFYSPPQPRDTISLFGVKGKLGEVMVSSDRRSYPNGTPADWRASVERGATNSQPLALAIQGSWPQTGSPNRELALDDPTSVRAVSDYLKDEGLDVPNPLLTGVYEVDLLGDGQKETLICAHSDPKDLRDDAKTVVYALALLHFGKKTIALEKQAAFKRADLTIDEFERTHGKRDSFRFLAFHDIDGDGRKEIVIYRAKDAATQIDVFTFDGRRARQVLSAYKHGYN
jgi:hypothetical protein